MDGQEPRRRRRQGQQMLEQQRRREEEKRQREEKQHRREMRLNAFGAALREAKRRAIGGWTGFLQLLRRIGLERLRLAAIALLLGLSVFCFVSAGGILLRTQKTKRLEKELVQLHADTAQEGQIAENETMQADAEQEKEETREAAAGATPSPVQLAQESLQNGKEELFAAVGTMNREADSGSALHKTWGDPLPEMAALHDRNHDLVAWLSIENVLDLPVVYKDNAYYLTHDFDGKKNASGTIFLDEEHPFRGDAQNLLLHGHNMKDGTMFGRLVQYMESVEYLKRHPIVELDTLWEKEQYVIFAVLDVSLDLKNERFIDYFGHASFDSKGAFDYFVRQLQRKSVYGIPVDVKSGDALLTLSTCLEEDRLVIVARKIREGEDVRKLRREVQLSAKQ